MKKISSPLISKNCFIGFDGFIDEIVRPIEKGKKPFPNIASFAEKIKQASNKSCNIELKTEQIKIGGNGPNTAFALASFGHKVTLAGTLDHPIFNPLKSLCKKTYSYGSPGITDAFEFQDGKLIFGKLKSLQNLTYQEVVKAIGEEKFAKILKTSDLVFQEIGLCFPC